MAALMKMCPKEMKKMIHSSWDSIKEQYHVMRENVMTWATNKTEEIGPVKMEVDWLEEKGRDDREADWWRCEVCQRRRNRGSVSEHEVLSLPRVRTHGEGVSAERKRK